MICPIVHSVRQSTLTRYSHRMHLLRSLSFCSLLQCSLLASFCRLNARRCSHSVEHPGHDTPCETCESGDSHLRVLKFSPAPGSTVRIIVPVNNIAMIIHTSSLTSLQTYNQYQQTSINDFAWFLIPPCRVVYSVTSRQHTDSILHTPLILELHPVQIAYTSQSYF